MPLSKLKSNFPTLTGWEYFFIKHISKVGCGHRFFFLGMAIFPHFLILEEQIYICRVVGGKSEMKADFHLIFPKYNCSIK